MHSLSSNCHHARPPNWPKAFRPFSFHTNHLRHLAPMISTVSLLNELLSMPMTLRCQVLCFTILYLFIAEFPTRLCFFLNKPWNCLWIVFRNLERYLFPAESSLTLNLWNKAIFLSYLIYLSLNRENIVIVFYIWKHCSEGNLLNCLLLVYDTIQRFLSWLCECAPFPVFCIYWLSSLIFIRALHKM